MAIPGPLLARDVAYMLLDVVPDASCSDGGFACSLLQVVGYMPLVLGTCGVLGLVLAIWLSVLGARGESTRVVARDAMRRGRRVLSGPIHTDGMWVRLVEDAQERRVIEVLDRGTWRSSTLGLFQVPADALMAVRPPG